MILKRINSKNVNNQHIQVKDSENEILANIYRDCVDFTALTVSVNELKEIVTIIENWDLFFDNLK